MRLMIGGISARRPHDGNDGRPSTGWHPQFGDVNNDGRDDLFITKGNVGQMLETAQIDPNNLLLQIANGQFIEVALQAGVASTAISRGGALADLNVDGRLDMVVVNRGSILKFFRMKLLEAIGCWWTLFNHIPIVTRLAVLLK